MYADSKLTPKRLRDRIVETARIIHGLARQGDARLHGFSRTMADYLARHHTTAALLRFPVGSPHPSTAEETWRRAKLEIQVGKYHDPFENLKKKLTEYFRTTRFKLDLYKYLQRLHAVGNHFGA